MARALREWLQETGGPNQGPNLLGVVGRKAGADPDFPMYSPALKDSGLKWSKKNLLTKPKK